MHRMSWSDLQYIHAVVAHGSLSAAARSLGVNHATVQRRIGAVETRFGISLFERLPGGYRLRPEGRDVLAALESIGRAADRIERSFAGVRRTVEGSFRLTTTDTIAALLLPPHLAALRRTYPDVRLELAITNMRIDMTRPLAEIAVLPVPQLPDGMEGESAGLLRFRVYGSPDYLSANTSADMAAHRWLGLGPSLSHTAPAAWLKAHLPGEADITADSFMALAAAAGAGLGLAMMPTFVGRNFGGLVRAAQFDVELTNPLWVAAHSDLRRMEPIAALIDFFTQALRADPELTD
ncbi:MAG: LysR family transcriptional regulator [Minwuia sp.]|uniref:LysR family transcriptional regulator n=1 Tax=Minwuia sp. TaxID=2493630 RepID=UPI003A8AA302